MKSVRMQVMPLENGLTRVLDLASKLWALYDSESGVFHTGFYFAELLLDPTAAPDGPGSLEDIPGIERVIEQSDLEVSR
jgi:hypothetical protein